MPIRIHNLTDNVERLIKDYVEIQGGRQGRFLPSSANRI